MNISANFLNTLKNRAAEVKNTIDETPRKYSKAEIVNALPEKTIWDDQAVANGETVLITPPKAVKQAVTEIGKCIADLIVLDENEGRMIRLRYTYKVSGVKLSELADSGFYCESLNESMTVLLGKPSPERIARAREIATDDRIPTYEEFDDQNVVTNTLDQYKKAVQFLAEIWDCDVTDAMIRAVVETMEREQAE